MQNKFFFIIALYLFTSLKLYGEIIYEKNNLAISSIDLEIYTELFKKNYNEEIDKPKALKDLIIINYVIDDMEEFNKEFIDKIDQDIINQFGKKAIDIKIVKYIYRFMLIRNEFIFDYFRNNLNDQELQNIFKSLNELNLPISENNCLIVKGIVNLKNNEYFIKSFHLNLKNNSKNFETILDDRKYDVCIDNKTFNNIESIIVQYIRNQTEEEFKSFIYDKVKN